LILREATGNPDFNINAAATSVRVPPYVSDDFPGFMVGAFGIYLVLPLMIIYLRMTFALLYEKEKKLREGMKMMGLQNTSFYLSWIITYFIIYTIISIIATILLRNHINLS
jgi:ATP-binding cassette subfamily A (ABC1) protein 3